MKGFAEAHVHHGGYERWVYDELTSLREAIGDGDNTEIESRLTNLETAIGDNSKGLIKNLNDLETRVKALEDAT